MKPEFHNTLVMSVMTIIWRCFKFVLIFYIWSHNIHTAHKDPATICSLQWDGSTEMLNGGRYRYFNHCWWKTSKYTVKKSWENFMTGHVGSEHLYRMEHLSADLEKLGAKTFLRLRVHSLDILPQKAFHKSHCQGPRAYLPEFLPVELLLHPCPTGPFCQSQ